MHPLFLYARSHALLLALALVFLLPQTSLAATLSITPASGSVSVGSAITVTVRVSSTAQAMNASSGEISFPSDLLRVSSVTKGPVLTLWVQDPSYSNIDGTVQWTGVAPNPGYQGSGGAILSVTFVAKKAGVAQISFGSSQVLANDGSGTNILMAANPASITIGVAPASAAPAIATTDLLLLAHITSSTHPDQTRWYSLSHAILDWTNAQGVSAVKLGYDQNADGTPIVSYKDPISHKELQLADGIWYFHVAEKDASGWGPVSTFRLQIDTAPPSPIVISFPNGATTASSTIATTFGTIDALSGIDHYAVSMDGVSTNVSAADGAGVYALPSGNAGTHTLSVTAYDKAGNSVSASQQFVSTYVVPASPSAWSGVVWLVANYLALVLIGLATLALVAYAGWYLWHRFHTFRHRVVNKEDRMHVLIHRQFNELKNAVAREIGALEDIKSKRELTIEEERLVNQLKKLIDESEYTIEEELDSVLKK